MATSIPVRSKEFDYSKPVDGSNPATDWQGLHTLEESITITNPDNGWIQNCNSTPFTAAAQYSPVASDYPSYMAPDNENFRGIQAVRILEDAEGLTIEKLIDLAYDPHLTAFEVLIPGIVKAYTKYPSNDSKIKAAIDTLKMWDFTVSINSVAMSLAQYYGQIYLRNGNPPGNLSYIDRVRYYGSESPLSERIKIFEQAIDQLEQDFGQWNTPWGEINRYQRLNGDIRQPFNDEKASTAIPMASSRWGALASFGARTYPGTNRMYGTSGNSFVAVVEFGDRVRAKSLLAGGQSGDPNSPHFDDQVNLYQAGTFKNVNYYRGDVEAKAEETYQPGIRE